MNADISNEKKMEALHGGDVYRNAVRLDYSVNLNPLTVPVQVMTECSNTLSGIRKYPDPHQYRKA